MQYVSRLGASRLRDQLKYCSLVVLATGECGAIKIAGSVKNKAALDLAPRTLIEVP
jgi:hypothetical protein